MSDAFCPTCHPERLPDEALRPERASRDHYATRFDDSAYVTCFLDGVKVEWASECIAGRDGWVVQFVRPFVLCDTCHNAFVEVVRGHVQVEVQPHYREFLQGVAQP